MRFKGNRRCSACLSSLSGYQAWGVNDWDAISRLHTYLKEEIQKITRPVYCWTCLLEECRHCPFVLKEHTDGKCPFDSTPFEFFDPESAYEWAEHYMWARAQGRR